MSQWITCLNMLRILCKMCGHGCRCLLNTIVICFGTNVQQLPIIHVSLTIHLWQIGHFAGAGDAPRPSSVEHINSIFNALQKWDAVPVVEVYTSQVDTDFMLVREHI